MGERSELVENFTGLRSQGRVQVTQGSGLNKCSDIQINLSLDELRLIAQNGNIRDFENKSEKDLIRALSEPKPKIKTDKKKLGEIRKDFSELRHKFSKKKRKAIKKLFMIFKTVDIFPHLK